jgi:prephenate dehydrogenase
MKLFNKVAIVGTGLIGGSIALAIKKKHLAHEVVGVSRRKKNLLFAKKIGAIDKGSQQIDVIKGADLVILATPVNTIIKLAPLISKIVKKDCIVSDVGSTKVEIVKNLSKIFSNFVGSHPLAGSEKASIVNAHERMFEGTLCVLTPTKNTYPAALNKIKILWQRIGAKTVLISPTKHDEILSFVSHLPHLAAFSLIGIIPKKYLKFASTGLRDVTRIAASDSELWAQILLSNQKNIIKSIGLLQANMSRIKFAVQRANKKQLMQILKKAKTKREYLA